MSKEYYVFVSLRLRLLVAGFFLFGAYETTAAHDWGPMVVFLIPAALASYAAVRLLVLQIGAVLWH